MESLEFISGGRELLDFVKPLWEKLNKHHEESSKNFSHKFSSLNFEVRKSKFINDEDMQVKIDLIKDKEQKKYIGYCISTINADLTGEIDSLFVNKAYRKYGIGDKLMTRALQWLDDNKVKTKIIGVAEGNENVLDFYKKYGFYKRRIILEQIEE